MSPADGNAHLAGAPDFDFFLGKWTVAHRKLKDRLRQSNDWSEFTGTVRVRSILAGLGNFDENVIDLPQGRYEACTLRFFDPGSSKWAIHWIDGRAPKLAPPLRGAFRDNTGTFFGDDQLEGRPIKVRSLWTPIDHEHCRCEQAFSGDSGQSWETHWIMEFQRQ